MVCMCCRGADTREEVGDEGAVATELKWGEIWCTTVAEIRSHTSH